MLYVSLYTYRPVHRRRRHAVAGQKQRIQKRIIERLARYKCGRIMGKALSTPLSLLAGIIAIASTIIVFTSDRQLGALGWSLYHSLCSFHSLIQKFYTPYRVHRRTYVNTYYLSNSPLQAGKKTIKFDGSSKYSQGEKKARKKSHNLSHSTARRFYTQHPDAYIHTTHPCSLRLFGQETPALLCLLP